MLTLVRRARRRLWMNDLFAQSVSAATAILLAFILLLLLGTEVLRWTWLVSIPLAAAGFAAFRVYRRRVSLYTAAQIVDRRLSLADTLSTAYFFTEVGRPPSGSEEICRLQRDAAVRLAQSADMRKAVPFTFPRGAYFTAAVALVAFSLFAMRYGLHRSLDLRPPIARIFQQTFGFEPKTEQARIQPPPSGIQPQDENADNQDRRQGAGNRQDDAAKADDSDQSQAANEQSQKAAGSKQGENGQKAESADKDGSSEQRDGNDVENSGDNQQGQNKPGQNQNAGNRQDSGSAENSSLMSKVKDAMQNLLSRMKPQQSQQGSPSPSDQRNNQAKNQQNGSRQQASKDGQPRNSGQQGDSQDGNASQQAQNSQDPMSKGTGKSDSSQAGKQPGSGIGSQDGDKSIREAEQLAAMGKISEILGKRSANLTGESTVEVQSTSQQLRTPYAQRGIRHSQSGSEINRDEVPVALQAFVAQYFEQVRKQAPAPKK